jgi:hypothetical protein
MKSVWGQEPLRKNFILDDTVAQGGIILRYRVLDVSYLPVPTCAVRIMRIHFKKEENSLFKEEFRFYAEHQVGRVKRFEEALRDKLYQCPGGTNQGNFNTIASIN